MALDPVPWFVGGAAEHSAEAARNIAWNATQGRTGVATSESLKVSALPTAGGGVRVSPGGAAIESTFAGATQQSYAVRNDATATVPIPANTSSSERHYRVSIVIKDPQYAGSARPDPANGPYTDWYVDSSWSEWPHVKLAFIRVPPHTSVITNSMIRDERELLNPRREDMIFARPRLFMDQEDDLERQMYLGRRTSGSLGNGGGEYFPGGGGSPNQINLVVPEWANRMLIEADWMSVRYHPGKQVQGFYWVEFGDEYRGHNGWPGDHQLQYATEGFFFDSPTHQTSTWMRANWRLMEERSVPSNLKGQEITLAFKAALTASADTNGVSMTGRSGLGMRITFAEESAGNRMI